MNRLQHATSPYLRQHAENPVDWYEWSDEAFQTARTADKPVILSIGYSACHWCHVMAHESFEDPETAAIMNREFVNIKVDREERPDLDDIYMQATLIFTRGHGGWPMTVFLTPDGRPFHAGTYYPKDGGRGMPTFKQIMAAVLDAYRNRRQQVEELANNVTEGLQRDLLGIGDARVALSPDLLLGALRNMTREFDSVHGGLSRGQPKFPSPMNYEFILSLSHFAADAETKSRALEIVGFTLKKMARGGIYDQLGGGFHRYSVDRQWLVPHFEKMLYDNAQLSRLYLHMWLATSDTFFKMMAEDIFDYLLREMQAPEGGFYSATDADSEGEEGKFFVWSIAEMRQLLTEAEAEAAIRYWDVTESGNFEGHNILNVPAEASHVAASLGISVSDLEAHILSARHKLYAARAHRIPPHRDDKVLTAWNALAIASFAEAGRALGRNDYLEAALHCAEFILANLRRDGRLLRSYMGGRAQFNGYLEDYANLAEALIQLYQSTSDARWLHEAIALVEVVLTHFSAPDGGFFDTSDDHEQLIARPRGLQDNATPSGNSMMAKVLLILTAYTGDGRYRAAALGILEPLSAAMLQYPQAFGETLCAARLTIYGIDEVALIGQNTALTAAIHQAYFPNVITAQAASNQGEDAFPPLLASRTLVNGAPSAYVCRDFACQMPVTSPEDLIRQLKAVAP